MLVRLSIHPFVRSFVSAAKAAFPQSRTFTTKATWYAAPAPAERVAEGKKLQTTISAAATLHCSSLFVVLRGELCSMSKRFVFNFGLKFTQIRREQLQSLKPPPTASVRIVFH